MFSNIFQYTSATRADLQTATQRINLVPGSIPDTSAHTRDSLSPGSTIDQVILASDWSILSILLIGQYYFNTQSSRSSATR